MESKKVLPHDSHDKIDLFLIFQMS